MTDSLSHHVRQEYCLNRLQYRNGRRLRAVKVYTVANESNHVLLFGVPKINLKQEVKFKLQRCGQIETLRSVAAELSKKVELEPFTDVFHVKFTKVQAARLAKLYLDTQEFYGGILHVSYAPEYETMDELRQKLMQRKADVIRRQQINEKGFVKIEPISQDDSELPKKKPKLY